MRVLRGHWTLSTVVVTLCACWVASSAPVTQHGVTKRTPDALRELQVIALTPAPISFAPVSTDVTVEFDRPVKLATVNAATFRVSGRWSGTAFGTYKVAKGGRAVTFTPDAPFSAGEVVSINLSHDIRGADNSPMRSAGYAYQFWTSTKPSIAAFTSISVLSNNTGEQTRIYGASAADLNHDGFLDLTTVNEVSADLRVFLNLADGTGNYGSYLPPTAIGSEASPNEPADFNNDGNADICVAAASSDAVYVVYGNGDGSFGTVLTIPVGHEPHGIMTLDVDGDGDLDIVNCNRLSDNLSLMINYGASGFGGPTFFDGGVSGEYGLAAGDMNGDGILDLVVAGRDSWNLSTLLCNGDGTFTQVGLPQPAGGPTWVVVLGDLDGDRKLDAATANSYVGNGATLHGNGNGTFTAPVIMPVGSHTVSSDLADLDGDGDLDWIISSFGGGFWRLYRNDGAGSFSFWQQINAPHNPSCAIPLDFDNDGDLDLALSDEIGDVLVLMKNL